ncbi:DUF2306 domain-containing protein [Teredinibacter purpureus]|uniref:hypothetical protein n=1 Tax=Teredinibacter purpureus TaxID=2731756 RepID=UPI0006963147|nr:hypothetical protein [Teredinibacter purpureus]
MQTFIHWLLKCTPVGLLLLLSSSASAARLTVEPDSSFFLHFGAAILLYAHIGGGAIGLLSGLIASLAPKGQKLHRFAGKIFFIAMFTSYLIGACVSPFLETEQKTNFVAAILALYLLVTGVLAAQRKTFRAGFAEKIGLIVALLITAMGVSFMVMSRQSVTGTVDGAPPQAFILFVVLGAIASVGELNVILRKTLTQRSRIIRHVWRMCLSFFIASGSLFFGQATLFPEWFNASLFPMIFGLFPIMVLIIGITKTLRPKLSEFYTRLHLKKPSD